MNKLARALLIPAIVVLAGSAAAANATTLSAAVIKGSSVYAPMDFFPAYRNRLGSRVDAGVARAVMTDIEAMYLRDGFVRPRIQVRDDLLAEGILSVDIQEVRLADVVLEGDAGPYSQQVSRSLRALLDEVPLRARSLPEALRRLRALPGLDIEADVMDQPGGSGAAVLSLKSSYRPFAVTLQWSNRGTEEVGPNFYSVQVVGNDLLHAHERIGAFYTTANPTSEYHALGAFAEMTVGHRGPLLGLSVLHSNSQPTLGGAQYNLFYPQDFAGLTASQQLLGGQRFNLNLGLALEYNDSHIRYEGDDLEADSLRTSQLGIRMDGLAVARGAYAVSVAWRHGFDALGAEISFLDGSMLKPTYDIGIANMVYSQGIGASLRARVELLGQFSGRMLPYVERFKLGGTHLGRGVSTALMAGDSGVGAKLELSYALRGLPRWMGGLVAYGFSDYGSVWQQDVSGRQYLGTGGIGLRSEHAHYRLSVEGGRPLTFSGAPPDGTSVFGEVQISL